MVPLTHLPERMAAKIRDLRAGLDRD